MNNPTPFPKNDSVRKDILVSEESREEIRVLIIDDEKVMRELLQGMIEETTSYRVESAASAEEGFRKYRMKFHQIIVLDIRLGGEMSGIDLLRKIRKFDKLVNCIMITGYGSIDVAVECMKAGAWDFITKPFSYDHFEVVINRAVEHYVLQKRARERDYFKELSRLDGLTQVYNRRLFDLILQAEVSRAVRYKTTFSLIFLDMDNLKRVNDTLGHQKGDEALIELAKTLKRVSRESDFVCRYGGDEFAVILPETTREGALIYAERIKKSVENLEIYPEGPEGGSDGRPISVSIGVIQFPSEGIDLDNLVKCADLALMDAKKDKNRIVSYHESRLRNDAGESRSPAGTSSD